MKSLFITLLSICSLCICAQQKATMKKKAFISSKVVDEKKVPVVAQIDVIDNEFKNLIERSESSSSGSFRISVPQKNNYIIYISNPAYLFQSVVVAIPDTVEYEKKLETIVLQKIEVGKKVVLKSLSFDFYQTIVLDESRPDLERIIALMNDKPNLQIEISGFTDKIGSVSFNRELSEQRAKAVVDVLISSGFDNTRMKYKGYGPDQPIASNFTEEGRQLNNRVELKILKLDFEPKKDDKKLKKGVLPVAIKQEDNNPPVNEDENEMEMEVDTVLVDKDLSADLVRSPDTLVKVDYKGKFIADQAPLAFSTVNLMSDKGIVFKSTLTDEFGAFEFLDVDGEQEVSFGLDVEQTKDFKTIFLADSAGAVIKELDKVNGEFVLALLPSEKTKLGKIYLVDTKLKALKTKSKKVFVNGRIIDENGHPIKVQIEVINNVTNVVVEKLQSSDEGRYSISVQSDKNYDFAFNKSGYLFQSVSMMISGTEGPEKNMEDIVLQKVEVGKKIVLNNIFFDSNESTLRKESFSELERAVKLMNDMSSLQIEISGHTDNVGSSKSNRQLSEQRAKAVTDYLISKGCDKDRMKYKGYGSGQPIAPNNSDAGRQLNRRTEFKVLKVDLAAEQLTKAQQMNENNTENLDNPDTNSEDLNKNNTSLVPEHLIYYDKDLNGVISYDEIIIAIDAFFEEDPKAKEKRNAKDSIFALLDFYFEQ